VSDRPLVIPKALWAPLKEIAALYRRYGSVQKAIFALIATYIVGSILSFGAYVVNSVLSVFDFAVASLVWARLRLVQVFGLVGFNIAAALEDVQMAAADAIASLGLLGPPVAIGFGALSLYGTYRVLVALAGELPVGSTVVDLLRLR